MENQSKEMVPVSQVKELQTRLDALLRKDVSRLGSGDVFFLQEAGQKTKRGFKVKIDLDYPIHFCFPASGNSKSMITAEGFDKLNQYAGIEVFRPKRVIGPDGQETGNPHFERDPKTHSIMSVFMRGIGIGLSPTGNLVAVDQTIFINLPTLLTQEIQAKIKKMPHLGVLGSINEKPKAVTFYGSRYEGKKKVYDENPTTTEAKGNWYFIPSTQELGYWVNLAHPEILSAFDSFTQKQRFLERTAFSVLKRLILSSHPAIATKTPTVTDMKTGEWEKVISAKAHVVVYGWQSLTASQEEKHEELAKMAERVEEGECMGNMEKIIRQEADGTQEEEIINPLNDADPSEVPFADPEGIEDVPGAQTSPVEEKPPEEKQSETKVSPKEALNKFMGSIGQDLEKQKKAAAVRNGLGIQTWSDLKKSDDSKILEFLKKAE